MVRLSVFVPIYHDSASFLKLRERILATLPEGYAPEFHVIDDSAGQDPGVKALGTLRGVQVVVMPGRRGHQRALVQSLRAFRGDGLIATMDADGQDRPEDLPALLGAWREGAVVLARRTERSEGAFFRLGYFFYKLLFRFLTGTVIRTGNFAVYDAATAASLLGRNSFRHAYASALVATAPRLVLVPCPRGARYFGRSRMGALRLTGHGLSQLAPFTPRIAARCAPVLAAVALAWFFLR